MARPNKNFEPQREKLIKIAFDLFVEQGYENTVITQIMQKAGLTKAGMYHYFASKEEILNAAVDYSIAKDVEQLREALKPLCVEDKMLHIIKGSASPSELIKQMVQIKYKNKDSYAAYLIRERIIHAYIPVMEEILQEGIDEGTYKVEYPYPAAEFLVLMGKAIVEPNILPEVNMETRRLRMHAFLQLMMGWLCPSAAHAEDVVALFEQALSKLEETEYGKV